MKNCNTNMLRLVVSHRYLILLLLGACSSAPVIKGGERPNASVDTDQQSERADMPDASASLGAAETPPGGDDSASDPSKTPVSGLGQEEFLTSAPDSPKKPKPPAPVSEEAACAGTELTPEVVEREIEIITETEREELKPVALYVVLDNSLSMSLSPGEMAYPAGDPRGGPGSRWNQAVGALTSFVNDPASAGIGIALQYFHPLGAGPVPNECDGSAHDTPHVAMGTLPGNAAAVMVSLALAAPTGFTPTVGALTGGVRYCQAYAQVNPDASCAVVIVTDGQPRGCGLCEGAIGIDCYDPASEGILVPLAASGLAANVKTFTIGMAGTSPEGFRLLEAIAVAGGTDCTPHTPGAEACDVSKTGAAGFSAALATIRDSIVVKETFVETKTIVETKTLPCEWGIPEPPDGEPFVPNLVNVLLEKEGGPAHSIGGVSSMPACDDAGGFGWYYDDPTAPRVIRACAESCTEIENAKDPVVKILLGCQTVPPPPPRLR